MVNIDSGWGEDEPYHNSTALSIIRTCICRLLPDAWHWGSMISSSINSVIMKPLITRLAYKKLVVIDRSQGNMQMGIFRQASYRPRLIGVHKGMFPGPWAIQVPGKRKN